MKDGATVTYRKYVTARAAPDTRRFSVVPLVIVLQLLPYSGEWCLYLRKYVATGVAPDAIEGIHCWKWVLPLPASISIITSITNTVDIRIVLVSVCNHWAIVVNIKDAVTVMCRTQMSLLQL